MIAAFLDDQRRQPDRADGLAKPAEALRRDIHLRLRVFAIDVEAEREHQRIGLKAFECGNRVPELVEEHRFRRAMRHRQVHVQAQAVARAALVVKAGDDRVEVGRIAVDGDVQHVGAVVEDLLDALTVMHVGVEDGHALELGAQRLRGNGGVVQVAEAAGCFAARVMAGRAAQRVSGALAMEDGLRAGSCALCRPIRRSPCVLADGATAVCQVAGGLGQHAPQRIGLAHEDVRHDLVAPVFGQAQPVGMSVLQEAQIGLAMHGGERRNAVIFGARNGKAEITRGLQQIQRARGHFLRRAHLAARVIALRMVQKLFRVKERQHG